MSLRVYPNGFNEDHEGSIYGCLINKGDTAVSLKGKLIASENTEEFDYEKLEPEGGLISIVFPHVDYIEAYKEKDFVLTAKLEAIGEPVKVVGNNSAAASKKRKFNVLENVYKKMQRTDFTLASELLSVTAVAERGCPHIT